MRQRRGSTWFFLAAVAVVTALAILPATGWLVRMQLRFAASRNLPGLTGKDGEAAALRRAAAAAAPNDYPIQLAAALTSAPPSAGPLGHDAPVLPGGLRSATTSALVGLEDRFDSQPGLHANVLRHLCEADLRSGRDDWRELEPPAKPSDAPAVPPGAPAALPKPEESSPEVLKLAEREAARGEALDPDNAYFPTMAAVALFAQHRDDEALAALIRAGAKSDWNEYADQETEARIALNRRAYGHGEAMAETAVRAAILFPNFALVRATARTAVVAAMHKEQAGDLAGGFAIRRAIMRVGALMRVKSNTAIGSMVGMAIANIAASRPGGAPPLDRSLPSDIRTARSEARYVTFLEKTGHADEAAWYLAERAAQEKTRAIIHDALREYDLIREMMKVAAGWGAGLLLLANVLWTLLAGGAAALLARTPRIRAGQPLHRGVRAGFVLAGLIPAVVSLVGYLAVDSGLDGGAGSAIGLFGAAFLAIALPVALLKRGETWRGFGRNLGICAATLAGIAAVLALAVVIVGPSPNSGAFGYVQSLQSMYGIKPDTNDAAAILLLALAATVGALVPLLLTLGFAIASRRRKVAASVGIVRGLRAAALPTAGVLLLLFSAAAIVTAKMEERMSATEARILKHEGRYFAETVGEEWPGFVGAKSAVTH